MSSLKAINPLGAQFVEAMKQAYNIEKESSEQWSQINHDRMQFVILHDLMFRYRGKTELLEAIRLRLNQEGFHLGMDAKKFILECADAIFKKKLERAKKLSDDIYSRMKELHPLWGDILMP
jgi:hypothetical protein